MLGVGFDIVGHTCILNGLYTKGRCYYDWYFGLLLYNKKDTNYLSALAILTNTNVKFFILTLEHDLTWILIYKHLYTEFIILDFFVDRLTNNFCATYYA